MIGLGFRLTLRGWKRMVLVSVGLAVALLFYSYYQITLERLAESAVDLATPPPLPGDALITFQNGIAVADYQYDFSSLVDVTDYFAVNQSSIWLEGQATEATLLALDMLQPRLNLKVALESGRLPSTADEVCLTATAAKQAALQLGDWLACADGRRLTVVGLLRSNSVLPLPLFVQNLVLFTQLTDQNTLHFAFAYFPASKNSQVMWALGSKYSRRYDVTVYSLMSSQEMGVDTRTIGEGLVSNMSTVLVLAVGAFLANMQLVGLLSKRKETQAMKAVGLSREQLLLFPLLDALWAGLVALPCFLLGWRFILPAFINERLGLLDPLAVRAAILGLAVCLGAGLLAGLVNSQGQFAE